jgi:hypothetical protein
MYPLGDGYLFGLQMFQAHNFAKYINLMDNIRWDSGQGCRANKIKVCEDFECRKPMSDSPIIVSSAVTLVDPRTGLIPQVMIVVDQSYIFEKDIYVKGYTYGDVLSKTYKVQVSVKSSKSPTVALEDPVYLTQTVPNIDITVKVSNKGEYPDEPDYKYVFPDIAYKNGSAPDKITYVWSGYSKLQGVSIKKVNGKQ